MSWDPVWDDIFRTHEWGKYPSEDIIRFIARNFYSAPDRSAVKMLEVGCGPGANLWFLAREGFSVFGIDGSPHAITRAQKRLDEERPGWSGELRTGDICELPYESESFDATIDNEAISTNCRDDSIKIYAELFRVTKPGGKLYTKMFATGCAGDNTGQQVGEKTWLVSEGPNVDRGPTRFTELSEIEQLLGSFRVCSIELTTRTEANRTQLISEWNVVGEKLAI
jgi:SAM-dependent methyltransferase